MKDIKKTNTRELDTKKLETKKLGMNALDQVNGGFVLAAFIVAGIGGAITGAIAYHELSD